MSPLSKWTVRRLLSVFGTPRSIPAFVGFNAASIRSVLVSQFTADHSSAVHLGPMTVDHGNAQAWTEGAAPARPQASPVTRRSWATRGAKPARGPVGLDARRLKVGTA